MKRVEFGFSTAVKFENLRETLVKSRISSPCLISPVIEYNYLRLRACFKHNVSRGVTRVCTFTYNLVYRSE